MRLALRSALILVALLAPLLGLAMPARAAGDVLVSVGSPPSPFPQNKQNEPAVAVDPNHPDLLVAGANDEIDLEPCPATPPGSDAARCPFTPGVGTSGVYFSFDRGATWTQPTYTGWSARTGTAQVGSIGTLPNYYEHGLVSDGDPALAFGPQPDANGHFDWSNGSRLYYANLTVNFPTAGHDTAFKGAEAIAVSRTDDARAAAANDATAWRAPVVISRQNAALFSDKDAIWADNAASSPFFGTVYVCNVAFRSSGKGGAPGPVMAARSTDGGDTWRQQQISQAANTTSGAGRSGGRQGCTLRTDSKGTLYVFWDGALKNQSVQYLARSFDGGKSFEKPRAVATKVDCGKVDPVSQDVTFDGIAGARTDSFPSVDIANGAPSGAGATDMIVLAWCDAAQGLNHEQALVQSSQDGGQSWSQPDNAATAGDRPDFPAIAIAPDGQNVYLTYDAFQTDWQSTTTHARPFQGVVRHGEVQNGKPTGWTTVGQGAVGDARGSSANALTGEFLGDYNDVVATNGYGFAVWNDARHAADCPAVDAFRQALVNQPDATPPFVIDACPATFGDTDIDGGAFAASTAHAKVNASRAGTRHHNGTAPGRTHRRRR